MRKIDETGRNFKFPSKKNGILVTVRTKEERAFSKYLEEWNTVISYVTGKPLMQERVRQIQHVDIRKEYIEEAWQSDFFLTYMDGSHGVRELASSLMLTKRADIEKLELSRRYWRSLGISDWKIVVMEG